MSEAPPRRGPVVETITAPAGYFRLTSNKRVHRVERAQRVTWPNGDSWISVMYWCMNIGSTKQGEIFLGKPTGIECQRCLKRLYGPMPRVR